MSNRMIKHGIVGITNCRKCVYVVILLWKICELTLLYNVSLTWLISLICQSNGMAGLLGFLMPLHVYILPKYMLDVTIFFIALKRFAVNRFHKVNYEDASVAHDRSS